MSQGLSYKEEQEMLERMAKAELPQLLIKLAEEATLPSKANPTDTCYDLTATSVRYDEELGFLEYGTGVFMHIPEGHEVKVFPRSSISRYDLFLCNGTGIIDESYRKEIFLRFKTTFDYEFAQYLPAHGLLKCAKEGILQAIYPVIYNVGDKIGQFEMKKKDLYTIKQIEDISDEGRGGFGSTGS